MAIPKKSPRYRKSAPWFLVVGGLVFGLHTCNIQVFGVHSFQSNWFPHIPEISQEGLTLSWWVSITLMYHEVFFTWSNWSNEHCKMIYKMIPIHSDPPGMTVDHYVTMLVLCNLYHYWIMQSFPYHATCCLTSYNPPIWICEEKAVLYSKIAMLLGTMISAIFFKEKLNT